MTFSKGYYIIKLERKGVKVEKEELRKEIEKLLDEIKTEREFNEDSGNLSFLYYQLYELQNRLELMSK